MTNLKVNVLGALLCLAAAGASAQGAGNNTNWYVGLDFGESKLERDDYDPVVIAQDDNSTAYALRVGYRFSKYFSLEAGYTDIGDFDTTYLTFCAITPPSACPIAEAQTSIDGFLVNAVGTWPIAAHFHLKAVLGATYRELKARTTHPTFGTSDSTDSGTAYSYGIGVAVPVNDHFEIDLDFTEYREIGLTLDMSSNAFLFDQTESRLIMLGMRYRF